MKDQLTFAAALGVLRLPDSLSRMHAATKPQTLGLLLILIGVGLTLRDLRIVGLLVVVTALQLLTAPVAGHRGPDRVPEAALRPDLLVGDELADDPAAAGSAWFRTAARVISPTAHRTTGPPGRCRAVSWLP